MFVHVDTNGNFADLSFLNDFVFNILWSSVQYSVPYSDKAE